MGQGLGVGGWVGGVWSLGCLAGERSEALRRRVGGGRLLEGPSRKHVGIQAGIRDRDGRGGRRGEVVVCGRWVGVWCARVMKDKSGKRKAVAGCGSVLKTFIASLPRC